jgi:hypothetical protein
MTIQSEESSFVRPLNPNFVEWDTSTCSRLECLGPYFSSKGVRHQSSRIHGSISRNTQKGTGLLSNRSSSKICFGKTCQMPLKTTGCITARYGRSRIFNMHLDHTTNQCSNRWQRERSILYKLISDLEFISTGSDVAKPRELSLPF